MNRSHSSIPSPVFADTRIVVIPGRSLSML